MQRSSRIFGLVIAGLAWGPAASAADAFQVDPVHSSVLFRVKHMKGETISGVEASMELKRSDFGMTYMVGPVGDEVRVTASLEGSRN